MADNRSAWMPGALYDYVVGHSTPPDATYAAITTDTEALTGGVANMQIGPDQYALMRILTQLIGVDLAIEIGTFTGTSAASVAAGLRPGGKLICCDISEEWTAIARRHWKQAGLADRIDLRIGPALDTLTALWGELGDTPVDLAFVDADKPSYIDYYESIVPRLRTGGVLLADNVLWDGKLADPAVTDRNTEALRAFNVHVAADPRVDQVILPVGDGVTLARKR